MGGRKMGIEPKSVNKPPLKGTKLQKNLGVSDSEIKRAVAVNYTIDVNRRGVDGTTGKEPRMRK